MKTNAKIGFIAGGILAAGGMTAMVSQAGRQGMTYENDLLNGAAAYVEHYDGNRPADALNYVLETINVAEESNKVQGLSGLEREVSEIRDEVIYLGGYRNPPTLYHAALEETAGKIRAVVEENTPSAAPSYAGAAAFAAGAALLALSAVSVLRSRKRTP